MPRVHLMHISLPLKRCDYSLLLDHLHRSSNPLDDLVSIFGNSGLGSSPAGGAVPGGGALQPMALSGLGFGGGMPMSPAPPMTPSVLGATTPIIAQRPNPPAPQTQPQSGTDDLLGLF